LRLWAVAIVVCVGYWSIQGAGAAVGAHRAKAAAAERLGVTAWLPYWEMPAALSSTLGNSSVIGTASPYWYDISGDSKVLDEQGAGSEAVIAQLLAHHEQIVPMVTEEAGIGAFAQILEDKSKRDALVRTLMKLGSHAGYAGLDIDFESFAYDPRHRTALADRLATLYPELISQTCVALHAIGRSCQVTVMPRTTAAHIYAHGDIPTWVYDYRALAAVADRVQVMAYDDHSPGGPAGPIAPLPWVKQVIAYARSQAANPSRYELGVPAYGYDWSGPTSATAVYASQVSALLTQVHAKPHWDAVDGEETFRYRLDHRQHTVWVVNAAADHERAELAAAAGFSGVAVWAAGYEQPQLWPGLDVSGPR
jgi:spore germination protein YaaH